jgi:hypothetical protein
MSETLKSVSFDAATGEITERPLSTDEIDNLKIIQAESEERKRQSEAKVAARDSALAKLAGVGLTEDEIAAL